MKPIAWSLASALIAAVSLAAAAAPATAGLDFTDKATFQALTPGVTFNGSSTLGTTASMTNGFGTTGLTLGWANTFPVGNATVDFSYNGTFGGVVGARYDTAVGSPAYTMVVEFGTITG